MSEATQALNAVLSEIDSAQRQLRNAASVLGRLIANDPKLLRDMSTYHLVTIKKQLRGFDAHRKCWVGE